jgi:hypothetical protein
MTMIMQSEPKPFEETIRVQVTKRLPRKEVISVVKDFAQQKLTFAVSRHKAEYEVWRQILPGDLPRIKNRKDGMTPAGVIAEDEHDLNSRNFICIWEEGNLVYGKMDRF